MPTILDLPSVSNRLKGYRARLAATQAEIAQELSEATGETMALRTFQSWESGSVQTSAANYEKLAIFYSDKLGEVITGSDIMFGVPAPLNGGAPTISDLRDSYGRHLDQIIGLVRQEIEVALAAFRVELLAELARVQTEQMPRSDSQPHSSPRRVKGASA